MSLIQRNAVPLFILLAVLAVSIGVLTVGVPFAFGEQPEGCDTTTVGISVITTDDDGNQVTVVSQRDVIYYTVTLSIPELPEEKVACNYGNGTLTITLPNGETVDLAGTAETGEITVVETGKVFTTVRVQYTVNQNDTIKRDPYDDDSLELTARVNYMDGESYSLPGSNGTQEASGSITTTVRINKPAIELVLTPAPGYETGSDSQTIHQGQTAWFQVVAHNRGGFDLHGVAFHSDDVLDCERPSVPTQSPFPVVPVSGSTEPYRCSLTLDPTILPDDWEEDIKAIVTASGGEIENHLGEAVDLVVTDDDYTKIVFDRVGLTIDIKPDLDPLTIIRDGELVTFTISATTPPETAVERVEIRVENTDRRNNPTELKDCDRNIGAVAAGVGVAQYSCSYALPLGENTITATITGKVPESNENGALSADDFTKVMVIAPGLNIVASSQSPVVGGFPKVRRGETSPISIVVTNTGDSLLTNVSAATKAGYHGVQNCDRDLSQLGDLKKDGAVTLKCESLPLTEEFTTFIFTVTGTAQDGDPESKESVPIEICTLDPSTAIGTKVHGEPVVVRMIVQTTTVTETNDGNAPLRDIKVYLTSNGRVPLTREPLTRESIEYIGGDIDNYGVLDVGETWEWRVVTVAVAAGVDVAILAGNARTLELTATGYGIDELGGPEGDGVIITYPLDVEELSTLEVPISAPPSS